MQEPTVPRTSDRREVAGAVLFAVVFFAGSAFLLSQLDGQTRNVRRTAMTSQPWFWPMISLFAMTGFGALHLLVTAWHGWRSRDLARELYEARGWLASVEYALWFVAFGLLVPVIGYLAASVLFMVALSLRAGYRSGAMLAFAALTGLAVVIVFKTMLGVNIPGGAVYEYLPAGLRNIMLQRF